MDQILILALVTVHGIIGFIKIMLFVYILLGLIFAFGKLTSNNLAVQIYTLLATVIEPMIQPFRGKFTRIGMLDLSPIAFIFTASVVQILLSNIVQYITSM